MGAEDEEAQMSPPWRRFSSVIMVIVMTKGQSYEMSILLHGANSFTRSKFYPHIKSPEKNTRQMDFGNALDGKTAPRGSQNPSSALLPAGAGLPLDLTKNIIQAGAVFYRP